MGHFKQLSCALAVVATSISCGDVVRQGRSPVFLVIDSLQASRGGPQLDPPTGTLLSDVLTNVTSPAPCTTTSPCPTIFNDSGLVRLSISPKNINDPTGPTSNNSVTITRYHVVYRRTDGRNTPGADVPYGWDGAVTGTVEFGQSVPLTFELVRHTSKEESPLVQLMTSATIISTIADVTFYGHDQVGNDVSVTGSISIDFGNFGD